MFDWEEEKQIFFAVYMKSSSGGKGVAWLRTRKDFSRDKYPFTQAYRAYLFEGKGA